MPNIGNQGFESGAISGNQEATIFLFQLLGRPIASYSPVGVQVVCDSGISDFLVYCYYNNVLLPLPNRGPISKVAGLVDIEFPARNLLMVNTDTFRVAVYHFETLSQYFHGTLKGSGTI